MKKILYVIGGLLLLLLGYFLWAKALGGFGFFSAIIGGGLILRAERA